METYQITVIPMGNATIIEGPELQSRNDSVAPNIKKKRKEWFGWWRRY